MGPHGRHGRYSWGGGRGVQRGQISRLVEPCILQLLAEGPKHGYELITSLVKFGFSPDIVESGMVYRALRDMEMAGWVVSEWAVGLTGPPRRVYTLLPDGKIAIDMWREELNRTHEIIHKLLDAKGNS